MFGTTFVQMCQAQAIRADGDRLYLTSSNCTEIATGVVVLAMGVSYRRLGIPALDELVGTRRLLRRLRLGGGAVHRALGLRRRRRQLGRTGRRPPGRHATQGDDPGAARRRSPRRCRATSSTRSRGSSNIDVRYRTEIVDGSGDGELETLTLHDSADGETETVPADAVFILIGAQPHTEWLPERGRPRPLRLRRDRGREQRLVAGPSALRVRVVDAGGLRGGRRAFGFGQAGGIGRRRRFRRDPAGASVPAAGGLRGQLTAAAVPKRLNHAAGYAASCAGRRIPAGLRPDQSRSGASTQPLGRYCADSRDLSLLELRCLQHVEVEVGRLPDEQTGHCASHLVSLGQRRVHHR